MIEISPSTFELLRVLKYFTAPRNTVLVLLGTVPWTAKVETA